VEESSENGHLERWFSGNQKPIKIYLHDVSKKFINSPKFLTMERRTWTMSRGCWSIRSWI